MFPIHLQGHSRAHAAGPMFVSVTMGNAPMTSTYGDAIAAVGGGVGRVGWSGRRPVTEGDVQIERE